MGVGRCLFEHPLRALALSVQVDSLVWVRTYVHIYMCIHTDMFTYICTNLSIDILSIYIYVCIYIRIDISIHIYLYIHKCTY